MSLCRIEWSSPPSSLTYSPTLKSHCNSPQTDNHPHHTSHPFFPPGWSRAERLLKSFIPKSNPAASPHLIPTIFDHETMTILPAASAEAQFHLMVVHPVQPEYTYIVFSIQVSVNHQSVSQSVSLQSFDATRWCLLLTAIGPLLLLRPPAPACTINMAFPSRRTDGRTRTTWLKAREAHADSRTGLKNRPRPGT